MFEKANLLTRYPAGCLTRDKGCGNSLVGLCKTKKYSLVTFNHPMLRNVKFSWTFPQTEA